MDFQLCNIEVEVKCCKSGSGSQVSNNITVLSNQRYFVY